jgi:DNA-binding response OmpR family regulator
MAKKILVADDEMKMRFLICDFLRMEGFQTIEAEDGEEALNIFLNDKDIDLLILDIMMPKMNGWEVCKKVREYSETIPILMLTAKDTNEDIIKGFKLGTDDYLTKPFHLPILVERIKALLRRTHQKETYTFGGMVIDTLAHTVSVNKEAVELSSKEYELLLYLVENKNVALTRDDIIKKVWNYDFLGDGRTIDTHIKTLRSKIGDCGDYIKTVWGVGYRFECPEEN